MYAVLDLETSGFSKTKNAICEIGILIVDSDFKIIEEYESLIKPYPRRKEHQEEGKKMVSYKEDAMKINGILMEDLEAAPDAEIIGKEVLEILTKYGVTTIIGHNAKSFDMPWIHEFLDRFGGGFKFDDVIDTLLMARRIRNVKKGNKLPELCELFGIENKDEHRALGDCNATLKLLQVLIELDLESTEN